MKQYFQNIWSGLYTIMIGMRVTFGHLFVPAVTIQYPDVRVKLPERERNRLYMNMDDCIGCDQCARACPVNCITIETVKAIPGEDLGKTSNGKKKALWVTQFDIDLAKCCYCQLCVFPCPTECIYMTDVYEFSELERTSLIYDYKTLTSAEAEEKKSNYAKFEAEKAALKAAAPPPAPKPAASSVPKPPVSTAGTEGTTIKAPAQTPPVEKTELKTPVQTPDKAAIKDPLQTPPPGSGTPTPPTTTEGEVKKIIDRKNGTAGADQKKDPGTGTEGEEKI